MNPHDVSKHCHAIEQLECRRLLANTMLRDIGPGELHGNPAELTRVGAWVYFVASAHVRGGFGSTIWELWRTDGTPQATHRLTHFVGSRPGASQAWDDTNSPGLAFYTGPRGLIAIGDALWYHDVRHSSSQVLLVTLNRLTADGTTTTWDLGSMNLSLGQQLRDIVNVDGRAYVFRSGDEFSLDPKLRRNAWWTIDDSDQLVATSKRRLADIAGAAPVYGASALLGDKRLAIRHDAASGRELWAMDNPTLDGGVLRIFGSDLADDILVSRRVSNSTRLDVRINGALSSFRFASVRKIQIDLGRGDDRAIVDEVGGAITLPVSLFGGAGNDTLQGASGRDTIYGGPGDDALYGGGNRDHLFGEHGNDRLLGGGGSDILWGGPGTDAFVKSGKTERRDFNAEDVLA